MFGIIKRNFLWVDIKTFCLLYKTMVRSQPEYAGSCWILIENTLDEVEKVLKNNKASKGVHKFIV